MGRKKVEGYCGICGSFGTLTYEHIPPRAAFNTGKFVIIPSEKAYNLGPKDFPKGPIFQGGIGRHSICGRCNNLTGHRYGSAFVEFAYQAATILKQSKFKPSLIYPYHIFPLRVLKQVISMFLSVNHKIPFREMYPELVKFVMNRDEKYLEPKFKIYIYYNHEGTTRFHPWSAVGDITNKHEVIKMTEISYPPFGFILTLDGSPMPEKRVYDISFFSRFDYNYWTDINLQLNVLPTHLQIPFDYRNEDEIMKAMIESKLEELKVNQLLSEQNSNNELSSN